MFGWRSAFLDRQLTAGTADVEESNVHDTNRSSIVECVVNKLTVQNFGDLRTVVQEYSVVDEQGQVVDCGYQRPAG